MVSLPLLIIIILRIPSSFAEKSTSDNSPNSSSESETSNSGVSNAVRIKLGRSFIEKFDEITMDSFQRPDNIEIYGNTTVERGLDLALMIWRPPFYILNSKKEKIYDVMEENQVMTLTNEGKIFYAFRVQATILCTMHLKLFPFDEQICSVQMGLFGYDDDEITLNWLTKGGKPIVYPERVRHLMEYEIDDFESSKFQKPSYHMVAPVFDSDKILTLTTSILELKFTLIRLVGYHVMQTFLPTTGMVLVSFFSFWIDRNAVPGRIALGITCVLTLQTIASGLRARLPPVSYYTAMDVWMFSCQTFAILALLEYVLVHFIVFEIKLPNMKKVFNSVDMETSDKEYNPSEKHKNEENLTKLARQKQSKSEYIDRMSRFIFPIIFIIWVIVYFVVCIAVDFD